MRTTLSIVALSLFGLAIPQLGHAGGAYHVCAHDCDVQRRDCLANVRAGAQLARDSCPGPRCLGEVRRQARVGRRMCRNAAPICADCCRACLESVDSCPGFSSGERVCRLDPGASPE